MAVNRKLVGIGTLIVALTAMSGSLYYSEIVQFFPCKLCWFQRILMYPVSLIALTGLLLQDRRSGFYCLALAAPGFLVSFYHYLLQWGFFAGEACSGIACSTRYVEYFGFITIPFMAGVAFLLIIIMNAYAIAKIKD